MVFPVSGATSYKWSVTNGTVNGSGRRVSIRFFTTGTQTISVRAVNRFGESTPSRMTVTVSPSPSSAGSISGSSIICEGSSFSYSVNSVSGMSYSWSVPSGWSISHGQGTSSITGTVGSSAGTVSVTPSNSCGSGESSSLSVNPGYIPEITGSISGSSSSCEGEARSYSISGVSGVTYIWLVPTGWTRVSDHGTSIDVIVGSNSGSITVFPKTSCGMGSSVSKYVKVSPTSFSAGSISASPGVLPCPGDSRTYSVNNMSGVMYSWIVPSGWSINSGQGTSSINVSVGSSSGYVRVTLSNSCGGSSSSSKYINPGDPPASAGSISVLPEVSPCPGDSRTYSVSNVSGVTYSWNVPYGWSINSGQGTSSISVSVGSNSGYVRVTPSNSCGSGSSSSRYASVSSLSVGPSGILSDNTCTSAGEPVTLTVQGGSLGTGATWRWYRGSCGGTSVGSGSSIEVSPTVSTTYYVRAEGGCNTTSCASKRIDIASEGAEGITSSDTAFSSPGYVVTLTAEGAPGTGYQWYWYSGSCGGNYLGTGNSIVVAPSSGTTYYVRAEGGCSESDCENIVINYRPLYGGSIEPEQVISSGDTPSLLSGTGSSPGGVGPLVYSWESTSSMDGNGLPTGFVPAGGNGGGESYQPGALEATTWYRRMVTDRQGTMAYSDTLKIEVTGEGEVIPPSELTAGGSSLTVRKGHLSGDASWVWYAGSSSFASGKTSTVGAPYSNRSTRYRVRAEWEEEDSSGTPNGKMGNSYFVSARVQVGESLNADESQNYIISYTPVKGKGTEGELSNLPLEEQGVVVQYFDGLGRPTQTVAANQSYFFNDLITGAGYDAYGRKDKEYIPSTYHGRGASVPNIDNNINSFYNGTEGNTVDGILSSRSANYAQIHYESSPLSRVLSEVDPAGDTTGYSYGTNQGNDILRLDVTDNGQMECNSYYGPAELYKTTTTDPVGNITMEYKDKQGQVVLKESAGARTYYAYDDFGLLRYVFPPLASATLSTSTVLAKSSGVVTGLCYYYDYDKWKRMVEKQLPGADPVLMVYDTRDRLVLVQDGNVRRENSNQWLYTKYEMFNRPSETGWVTISGDHAALQTAFDTGINFPANSAFGDVLTQTFYDEYPSENMCTLSTLNEEVKGQVTHQRSRLLDGSGYQDTYLFYDDKYRVIQRTTTGGPIGVTVENTYDFAGNVITSREVYSGEVSQAFTRYYTYDHAGRLEKVEQEIENDSRNGRVVVASMDYNELGQLMLKKLHMSNDTSYVQDIDYMYDVRGWLKSINNFEDTTLRKLYAQSLDYYGNGNIRRMAWRNTLLDDDGWVVPVNREQYDFTYDGLNRLDSANYSETDFFSGSIVHSGNFDTRYGYDLNGNIRQLSRQGNLHASNAGSPSYGSMDALVYNYPANSNRLSSVNDNGVGSSHDLEYKPVTGSYVYDKNGNATTVPGKGTIHYNYLNLPRQVVASQGTINYLYDASGVKLKKTAGSSQSYYQGSVLKMDGRVAVLTGEGRVVDNGGEWEYEYDVKDHLGNTRVSFGVDTVRAVPLQYKDYYPFGMEMAKWYKSDVSATKYLYNGKELQEDYGLDLYDYGFRFYDPAIARWHSIDPLAEDPLNISMTPYSYVANNPIIFIDPNGENWFYYQSGDDEDKSWHYHDGNSATYTDADGNEQTIDGGYEYLVTFETTGTNDEGATVGTLTVYNQNEVAVTSEGFSGGSDWEFAEAKDGNYMMRLDIRDSDGPSKMNADESNPEPAWGIQNIPENTFLPSESNPGYGYVINGAYGDGRIRLLETDGNLNISKTQKHGYYLHGKNDSHNYTHGCVCDKRQKVFKYFWSGGGSSHRKKTPFVKNGTIKR